MRTFTSVLLLMLAIPNFINAQIKGAKVQDLKNSTLYVVITGEKELDENLQKAFKEHWVYNDKIRFAEPEDISDEDYRIDFYSEILVLETSYDNVVTNREEIGDVVKLGLFRGDAVGAISFNRLADLSVADFVDALNRMQFFLAEIEKEGSWNKAWKSTKKAYGPELKDKTLLIDQQLMKSSLTEDDIREIYPYEFKITDKDEIDRVIQNGDEDYAYISVVEMRPNFYVHYICGASDGKIYGHKHSMIQAPATSGILVDILVGTKDFKKLTKYVE